MFFVFDNKRKASTFLGKTLQAVLSIMLVKNQHKTNYLWCVAQVSCSMGFSREVFRCPAIDD